MKIKREGLSQVAKDDLILSYYLRKTAVGGWHERLFMAAFYGLCGRSQLRRRCGIGVV